MEKGIREVLEELYRSESGRILASLIRLLGDFDLAEDVMQEAFGAALEQWPQAGVPANPAAWLISVGRFKGIDRQRKNARSTPLDEDADIPVGDAGIAEVDEGPRADFADDRLRLIFTCCHPDLPPEARAALTLREVCGLTTEEIARAFLVEPAAMAQRIVRAKNKIRDNGIAYEIPSPEALSARLETVLQVIYLVFNEGYYASSGESLTRADLSGEAIRLGRVLLGLLPEPEVKGLMSLMLLHESRRPARATAQGELLLLEEQDRSLWSQTLIKEGVALVEEALASQRFGIYALQAAIAAVHAEAPTTEATDWMEITQLYDRLMQARPSPVIELNRAVAIAMRDGPAAGLALVDDLLARGELDHYALLYSVRADLSRRLGKLDQARVDYRQALTMAKQAPEKRFLEKRLKEIS